MKFFLSLFAISFLTFCQSGIITDCSGKAIINSDGSLINDPTNDVTLAFNGPASCATLDPEDDGFCCYIKIKFENDNLEEKFTHKGCYFLAQDTYNNITQQDDFDILIEDLEQKFDKINQNLTSKTISVDCSSKYLQLVEIALILLLL